MMMDLVNRFHEKYYKSEHSDPSLQILFQDLSIPMKNII